MFHFYHICRTQNTVNAQPSSPPMFEKIVPYFKQKFFFFWGSLRLRFYNLFVFVLIFGCPFPPLGPDWYHVWSVIGPILFGFGRSFDLWSPIVPDSTINSRKPGEETRSVKIFIEVNRWCQKFHIKAYCHGPSPTCYQFVRRTFIIRSLSANFTFRKISGGLKSLLNVFIHESCRLRTILRCAGAVRLKPQVIEPGAWRIMYPTPQITKTNP